MRMHMDLRQGFRKDTHMHSKIVPQNPRSYRHTDTDASNTDTGRETQMKTQINTDIGADTDTQHTDTQTHTQRENTQRTHTDTPAHPSLAVSPCPGLAVEGGGAHAQTHRHSDTHADRETATLSHTQTHTGALALTCPGLCLFINTGTEVQTIKAHGGVQANHTPKGQARLNKAEANKGAGLSEVRHLTATHLLSVAKP